MIRACLAWFKFSHISHWAFHLVRLSMLKPCDCRCATKQVVLVVCPLTPQSPPFCLPRLPSCVAKSAAAEDTRSRHTGSNCQDNLVCDASPIEHRLELCTARVHYNASEFSVFFILCFSPGPNAASPPLNSLSFFPHLGRFPPPHQVTFSLICPSLFSLSRCQVSWSYFFSLLAAHPFPPSQVHRLLFPVATLSE